jgi:hypothetical protein
MTERNIGAAHTFATLRGVLLAAYGPSFFGALDADRIPQEHEQIGQQVSCVLADLLPS